MTKQQILATPTVYLAFVKAWLGKIDYDPCPQGHTTDGLLTDWVGRVYVNPPWGYDFEGDGLLLTTWLCKGLLTIVDSDNPNDRVLFYVPYYPASRWWQTCVDNRMQIVAIFPDSLSRVIKEDNSIGDVIPTCLLEVKR